MPKIHGPRPTVPCGPQDVTPPATPKILRSMAFDRAAADASISTRSSNASGRSSGTRDPLYIELGNVELGTRIELINLSANPAANFDKNNTITLELTGRDVTNRVGAVYVTQEQMEKLGLQPGDMYMLRAVDRAGNASEAVQGELQPNEWTTGEVIEGGRLTGIRGRSLSALDGEGVRKNLVAKAVNDTRPPLLLEDRVTLETNSDNIVQMVFDRALEPNATVRVVNTRDGTTFTGTVDAEGQLKVALKGVVDGDPLVLSVTDNNGVRGQNVEIVYSSRCPGGKAPNVKGGLGVRLTGVI